MLQLNRAINGQARVQLCMIVQNYAALAMRMSVRGTVTGPFFQSNTPPHPNFFCFDVTTAKPLGHGVAAHAETLRDYFYGEWGQIGTIRLDILGIKLIDHGTFLRQISVLNFHPIIFSYVAV